MADIVKVNVYVGEDYPANAASIREIRPRYFVSDDPTSTFVRVASFANPDYLFGIEAVAVLPDAAAP